jgi:hypothetical protein
VKQIELIERGRFLGEEFLLWLWMQGIAEGGASGLSGDTSACFLDDEVLLVTERGDVKELSLRKGNPPESLEAFEAISRGMRPYRAKLRIMAGDMEWVFSLDAPQLDVSSMKLPPTHAKDLPSRISDRMILLEEGLGHLERRFAAFLALRSEDPRALEAKMKEWVSEGLAQASLAQG